MQTSLFCKCLEVLCHNFVPFARCTPRIFWCYSFIRFPKPFIIIFGELLFDSSIACRLNVFSFSNKKLISIIFTKKYINLPIQMIEILRFRQEWNCFGPPKKGNSVFSIRNFGILISLKSHARAPSKNPYQSLNFRVRVWCYIIQMV